MRDMKTASATWRLECNVSCPECENYIDLLEWDNLQDAHEKLPGVLKSEIDLDIKVECKQCKCVFIVNDVQY